MINLHFEKNSNGLDPFKEQIQTKFNKSISKIQAKIPIDNVKVLIWDKPELSIPETGSGGYAVDAKHLNVYLNPDLADFERTVIGKKLERTLAHELHHCLRWKDPGYGDTLLETLISEGLADHFEIEVSGGQPADWDTRLTPGQIQEWLKKAQLGFSNKDGINAWLFGSEEKGIPKSTGYCLGFYLVGEYLKKHPKQRASTLYNKKAEEFLK